MRSMTFTPAAVLVFGALSTGAQAQISYIAQHREVSATAGFGDFPEHTEPAGTTDQSYTNDGLGEWSVNVDWGLTAFNSEGIPYSTVTATGYQTSNLASDRITARGAAEIITGPPANSSGARSKSIVDVTFTLDQATGYQLDMSMHQNYYGEISLTGPGTNIIWDPLDDDLDFDRSLSQSGTLEAGTYHLYINPTSEYDLVPATYDFSLVIPAPASAGVLALGGLDMTRRRR